MDIRFSKIAAIEFRHDYFLKTPINWNEEWPELYNKDLIPTIHPTTDTRQSLANYGMRVLKTPKGFDVYAEVEEIGNKLFLKKRNNANFKLAFFCSPPTASWWNFTRSTQQKLNLCYFSNITGLKTGGSDDTLYLHNEIETSAAGEKQPATLVRNANTVYEALQLTNSQPPGAHWAVLGTHKNFTTLKNQVRIFTNSVEIVDASLAGKTIEIRDAYNAVVFYKTIDLDSTLTSINIDVKPLPEGLYTAHLDGSEQQKFYRASQWPQNAFGLIELFFQGNPSAIPAPHQLANDWLPIGNGQAGIDAGEINPRTFVVHFLPHRAKWKYILSKDIEVQAPDIAAAGYQKLDDTTFLSNTPITITKTVKGADFGLENAFPAPGNTLLKTLKNGSDQVEFYVSEIFVNV